MHVKRALICLALGTGAAYAAAVALASDPPRMTSGSTAGTLTLAGGAVTDYDAMDIRGMSLGRDWIAELRKVSRPDEPSRFSACMTFSAGLPLRCVRAELRGEPEPGLPTRVQSSSVSVSGGYLTSRASALLRTAPAVEIDAIRIVAFAPRPLHLLANGAVMGAACYLPLVIGRAAVRCRRRARGQCLACGYPLAADVCSECGRAAHRTILHELPRAQT